MAGNLGDYLILDFTCVFFYRRSSFPWRFSNRSQHSIICILFHFLFNFILSNRVQ